MKKLNEHDVKPGQIWKVACDSNPSLRALVIISRKPFQLKGQWCVRVVPTHLIPCPEDIDDNTDFVVEPEGVPTGAGFLVEWWNERPVLVSNLAGLFGVLPDGVHCRLDWVLRYPERMSDPTAESVKRFRERERERGDRISADFKQLCC